MRIGSILSSLQTVWEKWNIRGLVLLSLSLQVILILFTPLRKRSASKWLFFSLWLSYLLADWAATFTVGHIAYRQKNDKFASDDNKALLAFWAPFLLLHLGGPDTITAFALEDNALWLRHLLNLIFQVSAAIYVFYQTLPKNKLWMPTLLMLFAGLIKYMERTRALYLASLKRFKESILKKPDPGLNYAKLMDRYSSFKDLIPPTSLTVLPETETENHDDKEGELNETEVVEFGFLFFKIFKGLIVDIYLTLPQRRKSREFIQKRSATDALKVISVELNFIYEILYTKVSVVYSKWGWLFRVIASSIVIVTLVLFTRLKKHEYHILDRMITYALLYGAICLDVIALLMHIFSDWSVVLSRRYGFKEMCSSITARYKPDFTKCFIDPTIKSRRCLATPILEKFYTAKHNHSITKSDKQLRPYDVFNTKIWFRRWSESIYAYNLLSVCLKLRSQNILKDDQKSHWCTVLVIIASIPLVIPGVIMLCFCLIGWSIRYCASLIKMDKNSREKWGTLLSYATKKWDTFVTYAAEKWDTFVTSTFVTYAAEKWDSSFSYAAKQLGLDEALDSTKYVSRNPFLTKLWDLIYDELQVKAVFAEIPKMAKQIYEARGEWVLQDGEWSGNPGEIMEHVRGDYDRILLKWHIATELCYNTDDSQDVAKELSKILSDYMLYLLMKQPTLMSNVAGISTIRFRDTCAEVKRFLEFKGLDEHDPLKDTCRKILSVNTSTKPLNVKGNASRSILFDGCRLAKELLKRDDKWKMVSRVWVELLSYAAGHCGAERHAQVLNKGGELLTLVWLLMVHVGIGDQFQNTEGDALFEA